MSDFGDNSFMRAAIGYPDDLYSVISDHSDILHPRPQLHLTLRRRIIHRRRTSGDTIFSNHVEEFCFSPETFNSCYDAYIPITQMLRRLGLESHLHLTIVFLVTNFIHANRVLRLLNILHVVPLTMQIDSVFVVEEESEEVWEEMGEMVYVFRGSGAAEEGVVKGLEKVEVREEGERCGICLEDVQVGEEVTGLPCKHCFHGECICKWLGTCHTCPICRHSLPT